MGLENVIEEVRKEIEKLNHVLRVLTGVKPAERAKGPRRKISAAGRRRIAAAQRARWRKIKAAKKK
jgi:hypothetical protein